MYEGKLNTDKWFPVLLLDTNGSGQTGKVIGDITVTYHWEGRTSRVTYSPGGSDWAEAGDGEYWIRIGASEFTSSGKWQVSVACSGCITHRFPVEVRTYCLEDTYRNDIESQLHLSTISVNNQYGSAIKAETQISGYHGAEFIGYGTGDGVKATGGSTGHGINFLGGSTSGDGIRSEAQAHGNGASFKGQDDGSTPALNAGYGVMMEAQNEGDGLLALGGPNSTSTTSGYGARLMAQNTTDGRAGLYGLGAGSGQGMLMVGGATGNGAQFDGMATSHGILANGGDDAASPGAGMQLVGGSNTNVGGSGIRILGQGGNSASGPAIYASGGQYSPGVNIVSGNDGSWGLLVECGQYSNGAIFADASNALSSADGIKSLHQANGYGINAKEIGDPVALDGGAASISGMLTKMADENNGVDFTSEYGSMYSRGVILSYAYGRLGTPLDLGDGHTISDNLSSMAGKTAGAVTFNREYDSLEALSDSESDNISLTQMKNLLFKRNVTARHASNGKPKTIEASAGDSAVIITTTLDTPAFPDYVKTEDYTDVP